MHRTTLTAETVDSREGTIHVKFMLGLAGATLLGATRDAVTIMSFGKA